ncbi:MAG: hypothetical protein IPJ41_18115 [Phycisphaerales bacterium]|nr:hypothetical protein [Phycisphaerales bacterium]
MPPSGERPSREPQGTIAVVGATGAVGREVLAILAERGLAPERVRALASTRSAGLSLPFGASEVQVAPLRT